MEMVIPAIFALYILTCNDFANKMFNYQNYYSFCRKSSKNFYCILFTLVFLLKLLD